ncbi:hypothetical protein M0802_002984 [Mischocyttarus mexicanus]|nr:hypothetical protein M0802_002984 [Mischocyttarus mexicanus]
MAAATAAAAAAYDKGNKPCVPVCVNVGSGAVVVRDETRGLRGRGVESVSLKLPTGWCFAVRKAPSLRASEA